MDLGVESVFSLGRVLGPISMYNHIIRQSTK